MSRKALERKMKKVYKRLDKLTALKKEFYEIQTDILWEAYKPGDWDGTVDAISAVLDKDIYRSRCAVKYLKDELRKLSRKKR